MKKKIIINKETGVEDPLQKRNPNLVKFFAIVSSIIPIDD